MKAHCFCSNQEKSGGFSSLGDDWRQQYPEAQHICEQLGISIFGMSTFCTQKLIGWVNFITVDLLINDPRRILPT
jgi:hypothetical protein